MQTPDIGRMILERTSDAHELEVPFGEWLHLEPIQLPTGWVVHVGRTAIDLSPTRNVVFMAVAAFLVWLTLWLSGRALTRQRGQGSGAPRGVPSMVEAVVLFTRHDVAIASIGRRNGAKFAPYILTLFWFILYCNLLGLVPYAKGGTANIAVTASRSPGDDAGKPASM